MTDSGIKRRWVPLLRFKDENGEAFPDWEKKRLSDIIKIIGGNAFKSFNFRSHGIPVIRISNISSKNNYLDLQNIVYHQELIKDLNYTIKEGDLLIAMSGATTGKASISNFKGKAYLNQRVGLFKKISLKLHYMFLVQFVFSKKFSSQLRSVLVAGAQPNVSSKEIESFIIVLPTKKEQQKIAAFLSAVDQRIHHLTRKKELLEEYKKGVMQKIFSQEIRFKKENGEAFPDWEEKRLGDMAQIVGGGTPDTNNSDYWNGDIQWFTPTEIRKKYIDKSVRTITQYGLQNSSAKVLPTGTILFTSRATIAEVAFCTTSCTTNQGFQSLIVNDRNDPELVYYLIIFYRKRFIRKSQGSTFLEISSREMKNIKFHVPCLVEQNRIGGLLSSLDTKIDQVDQQIAETQTFKKGLLQQMFV